MRKKAVILTVLDPETGKEFRQGVDIGEFPIFSWRYIEDMRAGFLVGGFDEAVTVLKKRQFRREILLKAAEQLAMQLADYIEDSEGWYVERRRETIARQLDA